MRDLPSGLPLVARLQSPLAVWRGRIGTALLTAGAIALMFACGDALKKDELDCEEAVSYLEGCCPGFDGRQIQCISQQSCGSSQYPAISEEQSACIRAASCAHLVASGVCQRAQQAWPVTSDSNHYGSPPSPHAQPDQVCP